MSSVGANGGNDHIEGSQLTPCSEALRGAVPGRRVDIVPSRREFEDGVVLHVQIRVDEDVQVSDRGAHKDFIESTDEDS